MQKENNNFIMGLSVGIAAASLIGLIIMGAILISQDNDDNAAENNKPAAINTNNNNPAPTPTPAAPTGAKANVEVSDSDNIRGNKDAKITIIEFSDIQCPYCSKFHNTMKQVAAAYPNDVRWVYKHFPLDSIHPYARKAAEAAECAGEQEKFWEYTDYLFDNQSSLNTEFISSAAKTVGLNTSNFESCLSSGKYADKVNNDYNQGRTAGVTGTPGSVINGELVKGAVSFETIKGKIESLK